jgi:hypothetical protein
MGHRFLRDGEPTLDEWRTYIRDVVLAGKDRNEDIDTSSFYATELFRSCYGRDFMVTIEGYIRLGPSGVSPGITIPLWEPFYTDIPLGDIICVFLGCEKPVVLRSQPEGHFLLVGDSFVYGLNDTAAFLWPTAEPLDCSDQLPSKKFRTVHTLFFSTQIRVSVLEKIRDCLLTRTGRELAWMT